MPTPRSRLTRPHGGTAGPDPQLFRDIEVRIPAHYSGDQAQEQFKAVMSQLDIRREVLTRVYNVRRARAEIKIEEAEALELQARLDADRTREEPRLTESQRIRMSGQRDLARANVEYQRERIEQWQLEILAWRATLAPEAEEG